MTKRARLILLLMRCCRVMTPRFAWWLGGVLGYWFSYASRRDSGRARDLLAVCFPHRQGSWVESSARHCMRHFGRMTLSMLAQYSESLPQLRRGVRVEGIDQLRQTIAAQRRGEGTLVLAGHVGNWELLSYLATSFMPLAVVGKRMRHPYQNDLIDHLRVRHGTTYIYQDEGIRPVVTHLRAGRILGILGDQDVGAIAGSFIPWFGHQAYTPIGPGAIASLARCPVQAMHVYRKGDHWVWHVGPRLKFSAPKREDAIMAIASYGSLYQQQLMTERCMLQWPWWHKRLRNTPQTKSDAASYDSSIWSRVTIETIHQ